MNEQLLRDSSRLASLSRSGLMDSAAEPAFDRLTILAAELLCVPVALVSLVDERRQFFKSCVGLPEPWSTVRETPLSHSFCRLAVISEAPLIINDARDDDRVCNNLAVRDLGVVAYLGVPIHSADGAVLGSFCIIDVVPRQWSEADLASVTRLCECVETEIHLRARLEENEKLLKLAEQASEKWSRDAELAQQISRRKSVFMAMLSHELRNPLAPLCTAAQMLLGGMINPEDRQETYQLICNQSALVIRMVNDMLDLSRIERGRLKLVRSSVAIADVVGSAFLAVQHVVEEQEHELIFEDHAAGLRVFGDHDRLVQVFSNLLTNACRYTPHGGRIEVRITEEGGQATVTVCDDGIGLSTENLNRVFELFAQSGDSTTEEQTGLGLGLAIVQELVRLHDGSVTVQSQGSGKGTKFQIQIPISVCEGEESLAGEPAAPSSSHDSADLALDLLIVDDTRAITVMMDRLLSKLGHTTRVARDVDEALQQVQERPPELIFSDVEMPGRNGLEFARMLKSDPSTDSIVLVAMTGRAMSEDKLETKQAGFDYHLCKPANIRDIKNLISQHFCGAKK